MSTIGARRKPFPKYLLERVFFMEQLNQNVLTDYIFNLKKSMYAGILEDLKLVYDDNNECPEIYLEIIKIKKKYRNQGYGSAVLQQIVQLADEHNVQIVLYATNIFGIDLKVLYKFYRKNGFVLIKNNKEGKFIYRPKKSGSGCNNIEE